MRSQRLSPRPGSSARAFLPRALGSGVEELRVDVVTDPLEQVFLIPNVVVERHRLDAELPTHPAHRDRVETLGIHDLEGGLDDPLP